MQQTAPQTDMMSEKRLNQRVSLHLLGRFMLENFQEFACQVVDMSTGSLAVVAPSVGRVGERVIFYIDHIGRLDGRITRMHDNGFAVEFSPSDRKRDALAAKLTWLANRHELSLPEDRRHERVSAKQPHVNVAMSDGRKYKATIFDLSMSGAALDIEVKPAIGSLVMIGQMRAQVVRHHDQGIAVEFATVQNADTLDRFLYH